MKLTPVIKDFIVHWGEMGTKWGINRTVAQIHALLYISPEPLSADEIIDLLMIARSNVSNSLKELENWGLIQVTHVLGDRKEHYESMKDVCDMFRVVLDERKKREVDPTLKVIKKCVEEMGADNRDDAYTKARLKDLEAFFEMTSQWYDRMKLLPMDKVMGFVKLENKIKGLFKK